MLKSTIRCRQDATARLCGAHFVNYTQWPTTSLAMRVLRLMAKALPGLTIAVLRFIDCVYNDQALRRSGRIVRWCGQGRLHEKTDLSERHFPATLYRASSIVSPS